MKLPQVSLRDLISERLKFLFPLKIGSSYALLAKISTAIYSSINNDTSNERKQNVTCQTL